MARTGGSKSSIPWPAGLLCAGVVGTLAWLAQPMLPVSVLWVGDMLRAATTPPVVLPVGESLATRAGSPGDIDCRALYPDSLWAELTWTPDVLLSQDAAPPPTEVTTLTEALTPAVRLSCHWRTHDGRAIVSTLAEVAPDAAPIADASLRGQGFTCASTAGSLECTRLSGDVLEEQTIRGGLWLSSLERGWHPTQYGARLTAHVWGQ